MWTRKELKTRAKAVLKLGYWKAFLVALVISVISGEGGGSFNLNWNFRNSRTAPFSNSFGHTELSFLPTIIIGIIFVVLVVMLIAIAIRIFLGYPLEVGGRRFFVKAAQNDIDMSYLGYGFGKGRYADIVKSMLYRGVLTFLWTLLLIIPGIVKSYAYAMVPYILSDNPNIGYKRAVELSNQMTDGHKADMWVLDLSFIGWYLLGTLALLIGVLFVRPYEFATKAELYLVLRQYALDRGICTPGELMLEHTDNQ